MTSAKSTKQAIIEALKQQFDPLLTVIRIKRTKLDIKRNKEVLKFLKKIQKAHEMAAHSKLKFL